MTTHQPLNLELQPPRFVPKRGPDGRFVARAKKVVRPVKRAGKASIAKPAAGFTRDRDVVAYLIKRTEHVTQFELRHQYGIKNPAQAINDFEAQYHVKLVTGPRMANGDIPYTLKQGVLPEIEGTLPLFVAGIEDPDEHLYVLELDLYFCDVCGRHPVYSPTKGDSGAPLHGICPRHGPQIFNRHG